MYLIFQANKVGSMSADEMIAETTRNNGAAIITVGIIQNGEKQVKIYGKNGQVLPPVEHVYEIGSITKTFTTSLLTKAVDEGRISLDDSIDQYLDLPPKGNYPTIQQLVTHTAGYKREYFEMPMMMNAFQGENAFLGVSKPMVLERISTINLTKEQYPTSYSNIGMAVVGLVLEEIYQADYSTVMNRYLAEELRLTHTKISDSSGDLGNYWKWHETDAYIPAGAITSTISDMLAYTNAHMTNRPAYLAQAHEPLVKWDSSSAALSKFNVQIDSVANGWMIDAKNNLIWHNGGTSDYNSYLAFDQERQLGVMILANTGPSYRIPATVIGVKMITDLQKEQMQ